MWVHGPFFRKNYSEWTIQDMCTTWKRSEFIVIVEISWHAGVSLVARGRWDLGGKGRIGAKLLSGIEYGYPEKLEVCASGILLQGIRRGIMLIMTLYVT
jgi:hypothetical protein